MCWEFCSCFCLLGPAAAAAPAAVVSYRLRCLALSLLTFLPPGLPLDLTALHTTGTLIDSPHLIQYPSLPPPPSLPFPFILLLLPHSPSLRSTEISLHHYRQPCLPAGGRPFCCFPSSTPLKFLPLPTLTLLPRDKK